MKKEKNVKEEKRVTAQTTFYFNDEKYERGCVYVIEKEHAELLEQGNLIKVLED